LRQREDLTRFLCITIIKLIAVIEEVNCDSRKNITALQVGYYRLSREPRALVIARGEELADQEAPPSGQKNREKPGAERGIAPGNKPNEVE
jgi:hypothetical protein